MDISWAVRVGCL